ncbi:hypothetical protein [Streptomyces abikoensis]
MFAAGGREAFVQCPCGHEWTDPEVTAAAVRQMKHLVDTGQPLFLPALRDAVLLLPALVEDQELAPLPDDAPAGQPDSEWARWEMGLWVADSAAPFFGYCLRAARTLTIQALPADGSIYARLYPRAGGSALDAHMAVVLLALALYETARREGASLSQTRLCDARSLLEPEHADRLRNIYPGVALQPGVSHLRVTDARRIQSASPEDWSRWRHAASDVLAYNIDDVAADRVRHWISAEDITFTDIFTEWLNDDLTWYTGRRL